MVASCSVNIDLLPPRKAALRDTCAQFAIAHAQSSRAVNRGMRRSKRGCLLDSYIIPNFAVPRC